MGQNMATTRTSSTKTAAVEKAPEDSKTRELEAQLKEMKEAVELLKFQAEQVERQKFHDPNECMRRAREVVRKSMEPQKGKYKWRVNRPDLYFPFEFSLDSDDETYAVAYFEKRFGTRYIRHHQIESQNDQIELVNDEEARQIVKEVS
jgi:hypothetical protein